MKNHYYEEILLLNGIYSLKRGNLTFFLDPRKVTKNVVTTIFLCHILPSSEKYKINDFQAFKGLNIPKIKVNKKLMKKEIQLFNNNRKKKYFSYFRR